MYRPPLEDYLAYLDGELAGNRRRLFEAYLTDNGEAVRRLRKIAVLEESLKNNLILLPLLAGDADSGDAEQTPDLSGLDPALVAGWIDGVLTPGEKVTLQLWLDGGGSRASAFHRETKTARDTTQIEYPDLPETVAESTSCERAANGRAWMSPAECRATAVKRNGRAPLPAGARGFAPQSSPARRRPGATTRVAFTLGYVHVQLGAALPRVVAHGPAATGASTERLRIEGEALVQLDGHTVGVRVGPATAAPSAAQLMLTLMDSLPAVAAPMPQTEPLGALVVTDAETGLECARQPLGLGRPVVLAALTAGVYRVAIAQIGTILVTITGAASGDDE